MLRISRVLTAAYSDKGCDVPILCIGEIKQGSSCIWYVIIEIYIRSAGGKIEGVRANAYN
jgi:hypothetical protein